MQNIPYEVQQDDGDNRRCGAAALCMIYRSMGIDENQHDVWEAIASDHQTGRRIAKTFRMAQNAVLHHLAAIPIRIVRPLAALELLAGITEVRTILNHRIRANSSRGHYTVLVDADDRWVTLHDPQYGPGRRLDADTLLELWQPVAPGMNKERSEITGNIAVLISACLTTQQGSRYATCSVCQSDIRLDPVVLLQERRQPNEEPLIGEMFCPMCDAVLDR